MDFNRNNAGLDRLFSRFSAFTEGNPSARFAPMHTPIDKYQQSPVLTKDALGAAATDTVAGVMVESNDGGAITLFTGNSPGAVERAGFLADMLTNFQTFYSWMKTYLDIRENGYSITGRPVLGENGEPTGDMEYLAIGPGFVSLEESPHVFASTPSSALSLLLEVEQTAAGAKA